VRSYWGDRRKTELKPLTKSDREKPRLVFFWVDAADRGVVRCRGTRKFLGYRIPVDASFFFDVKAPTLNRFEAVTGEPRIIFENKIWRIRFGALRQEGKPQKKRVGIQWDWKVTMPMRHGGWIKDLQTLRQGREKTQLLRKGSRDTQKLVFKHPDKDPHDQLDQSPHDAGLEATYSAKGIYPPVEFPLKLEAGQAFHDTATYDSPDTAMEPLDVNLSVNQSFKYYILYKPAKPGSIWVPVAKAEWFWKAKAKRQGAGWVLTEKEGALSKKGALTTEFPHYESNAIENKWITISD
jgi:hypothetical protein